MREILFRGKLRGGRWAEGNLEVKKDFFCIITPDDTPLGCYGQVDPDTVGQYTGLTDKNGTKIFEGDIIYGYLGNGLRKEAGVVVFDDGCWEVHNHVGRWLADLYDVNKPEVISNIHDNPELLEARHAE